MILDFIMLRWIAPPAGSSEPTYLYDNPGLHTINLRGVFITQHGRKIRTVSAKVQDLDRMCRTPEIKGMDNSEMDDLYRVVNIPWQRALNLRRMVDIRRWWRRVGATSANGALIYLDAQAIFNDGDTDCQLTLDPSNWTFEECPECNWEPQEIDAGFVGWFADVCPKCEYNRKPALVVDGQHRIRGMSADPDGGHEEEPVFASFLCVSDGFNKARVSEIFTEITSAAEPLKDLHQEFLSAKYDLAPKYDSTGGPGSRGVIRKRAYGIVSGLNNSATRWTTTPARKKGRVEMIERSPSIPSDVIDARRLTDYIANYMEMDLDIAGGNIVPLDYAVLTDTEITEALECFLEATLVVWPGHLYWEPGRRPTGALQTRGIFRMLMHCFKVITARIRLVGGALDTPNYSEELEHIQSIIWTDPPMRAVYTRQDADQNKVRRILSHIYDIAPNPLTGTPSIPPAINGWMADPPEVVTLVNCTADVGANQFSIEFCSTFTPTGGVPSPAIAWPLKAKRSAAMKIVNATSGVGEALIEIKSNPFSISFTDLGFTPTVGDDLEIEISFTSWNPAPSSLVHTETVV